MFPTNKHLDGRELSCVALFPGVDTLAEDDAVGTAGKLTVEECEVSHISKIEFLKILFEFFRRRLPD